jgi:hypothetical protein
MFDIQSILRERRGLAIRISRELGITHGAVSQWRRVPAERVLDVERLTGIERHVLRPDIYPRERPATSARPS